MQEIVDFAKNSNTFNFQDIYHIPQIMLSLSKAPGDESLGERLS